MAVTDASLAIGLVAYRLKCGPPLHDSTRGRGARADAELLYPQTNAELRPAETGQAPSLHEGGAAKLEPRQARS